MKNNHKIAFDDGSSYEGEVKGEFMHGYGEYYFPRGEGFYIGQFQYDFFTGYGILINTDGSRYVGEFQDDKYNGFGKLIDPNGDSFYGEFRLGCKEGSGVLVMTNGRKIIGFYKNGLRDGLFTVINPDGKTTWALYSGGTRRKSFSLEIWNDETIVIKKSTNHSTLFGEVGIRTKGMIKNPKDLYVGVIHRDLGVPHGSGIKDTIVQDGYLVHGQFSEGTMKDETFRTHISEDRKKHSKNDSFFANHRTDPERVLFLDYYHPYRKGENPDFNEFSEQILNLKRNNDDTGLKYFSRRLNNYFNPDFEFVIVIVPSHNPQKTESGIKRLAQVLAKKNDNITDGTDCLVRTDFIEKLSHGGDRDISVHLESMELKNIKKIRNKFVLLFDDVTTTNNSLLAGQELLKDAGAKVVQPFALGQTN